MSDPKPNSPTPDRCPTCGSPKKDVRIPPTRALEMLGATCPDDWHRQPEATPEGETVPSRTNSFTGKDFVDSCEEQGIILGPSIELCKEDRLHAPAEQQRAAVASPAMRAEAQVTDSEIEKFCDSTRAFIWERVRRLIEIEMHHAAALTAGKDKRLAELEAELAQARAALEPTPQEEK